MIDNARRVATLLKLLANENRLLVLCALMGGDKTVGEIASAVPHITLGALSQHLAQLKASGILDSIKSGQNVTYRIADERVIEVMSVLEKHYCV